MLGATGSPRNNRLVMDRRFLWSKFYFSRFPFFLRCLCQSSLKPVHSSVAVRLLCTAYISFRLRKYHLYPMKCET